MGGRGSSIKSKRSKLASVAPESPVETRGSSDLIDSLIKEPKELSDEELIKLMASGGLTDEQIDELAKKDYFRFRGRDKDHDGFYYDAEHGFTIDWFAKHSNNQEIFDNYSTEDKRWWESEWIPGDFMDGSLYPESSRYDEKSHAKANAYLDEATLDAGIIVRRRATTEMLLGVGEIREKGDLDLGNELSNLKGAIIQNTAPMSTGAANEGLTIGRGWRKPVEYVYHIPGGVKGVGMYIGDPKINGSFGGGQREFVINSDGVWAVGGNHQRSDGVWEVDMWYIGKRPHTARRSRR